MVQRPDYTSRTPPQKSAFPSQERRFLCSKKRWKLLGRFGFGCFVVGFYGVLRSINGIAGKVFHLLYNGRVRHGFHSIGYFLTHCRVRNSCHKVGGSVLCLVNHRSIGGYGGYGGYRGGYYGGGHGRW